MSNTDYSQSQSYGVDGTYTTQGGTVYDAAAAYNYSGYDYNQMQNYSSYEGYQSYGYGQTGYDYYNYYSQPGAATTTGAVTPAAQTQR
ncbi:hypothetical protein DPMN_124484 [Dreissena polymorpha]|uniref:Uncharacterized protein n=1 Tax=Dreissena polymorpha TaxID=45954 RepID=A0A9D4JTV7_DREPO|nr:hypothetical protein DPMN_124484 [Dreissena polymorpha]